LVAITVKEWFSYALLVIVHSGPIWNRTWSSRRMRHSETVVKGNPNAVSVYFNQTR
jgi:hypothetical protein